MGCATRQPETHSMPRLRWIACLLLCLSPIFLTAQNPQTLLDTLIDLGKTTAANRETVDWPQLETELRQEEQAGGIVDAAKHLLKALGDFHGKFWMDRVPYTGLQKEWKPTSLTLDSTLLAQYKGMEFPVKVVELPNRIGYIQVPGRIWGANDSLFAGEIYRGILDMESKHKMKGWIVDLRLNGGGTMYPMLAGLSPLLGEGIIGYFSGPNGEGKQPWELKKGELWLFGQPMTDYGLPEKFGEKDLSKRRVAVLTSLGTVSSGEATAIAFSGRPNTRSFGEETGGYTTNVSWNAIRSNMVLQLTVSYFADRNGQVYAAEPVVPDMLLKGGDDFGEIGKDAQVERAREWVESR